MPAERIAVLAVTNHYPTEEMRGDAPCIRDQITALRDRGIEVDVLAIDRRRRRRSYLQVALRMLLTPFRTKRYDLVHAYYGYAGLLARLQLEVPVVLTFRGSDLLSKRNRYLGPLVARSVEGVIVMSEEMRRVSGRQDARIIPFGVDRSLFRPCPSAQARAALGLPPGDRLVLFPWDPGRPEKRFDIVEAAVEKLNESDGRVRLIVVWDEPPEILVRYMNACDALVLASDREGAPMSVREAVACNLPVVSVDVGDVRQVIGSLEGCHLCEQDADDVAEKLRTVLDRGRRLEGERVAEGLGLSEATERVIAVYESVLSRGEPAARERARLLRVPSPSAPHSALRRQSGAR